MGYVAPFITLFLPLPDFTLAKLLLQAYNCCFNLKLKRVIPFFTPKCIGDFI
jgi:hypothetical protein